MPTYSWGPLPPAKSKIPRHHPQTLSHTGYIIIIIWLQGPSLSPILKPITQRNGRLHTRLPGLHADRARCLPQGRRFRGRILNLCLPLAIFSPLLATVPNFDNSFWPLKIQSNSGTPSRPPFGRHRPTCWHGPLHPTRSKTPRPHPQISHPHSASLSLGTSTSSPILTPYNPKQWGYT